MTLPDPLAAWRFSSNLLDSSGNGNTLTAEGAGVTYPSGKVGTAVLTNVVTRLKILATAGNSLGRMDQAFSSSWWAKIPTQQDWSFDGSVTLDAWSPFAMNNGGGAVDATFTFGGTGFVYKDWPAGLTGWHHFAWTKPAGTSGIKMYVDGVLIGTTNTDVADNYSGSAYWVIAPFATRGGAYEMPVDAVHLFGSELDASQIAELYNSGAGYEWTPPVQRSPDEFYYLMF